MAVAGTRIVEVRVDVPAALVGLLRLSHLVVSALDGLLTPGVKVRHAVVPCTLHGHGLRCASRKVGRCRRIEKGGRRVAAGSAVCCWGRSGVVPVESVYGGPAISVEG